MHDLIQQIIGEKLSAVVFVMDDYQFQFDGSTCNVMTPVTICSEAGSATTGDDQFRNLVCGQIAKVVRAAAVRPGEAIVLTVEDASELLFSLREADYVGPEAVFFGLDGEWDVL